MANVLDFALKLREQRRREELADISAIPTAVEAFINGTQARRKIEQDKLAIDVSLAKSGLKLDPSGNITRDDSLTDPTSQLIKMGQIADARLKMAQLGIGLPGSQRQTNQTISQAEDQTTPVQDDTIVLERNAFGVPTKTASRSGLAAKKRIEQLGEANFKREVFRKDLESFKALDDELVRGEEGLDRFKVGVQTTTQQIFKGGTRRGASAAVHDGARKRLRVQLVRAAGDVGNINIVEQKAAEELIPNRFDSVKAAQIKRAFLDEIGKAISQNPDNSLSQQNAVKDILNRFASEELNLPTANNITPDDIKRELEKRRGKK